MAQQTTRGARVRSLRTDRKPKLTQAEAADAIGISRTHLSKIENDEYAGGRETLAAIATYYGVSMDYLEFGPEPGGPEVVQEGFNRDDQLAWLTLGAELGHDSRMAIVDLAHKTILSASSSRGARERRSKK